VQALLIHLIWASIPLALVVALARRFSVRLAADAPFQVRWDLGLAVGGGLLFAVMSTFVLADQMLEGTPVTGADFHDYCACIGASRGDHAAGWRATRSIASGIMPALLARWLGVIDGLLAGAFLSQWVMGAGISLWARALHSRLAGVAAVMLACAVAPLVSLARSVTFYPEIVAVSVLSAAMVALALRTRSLWGVLGSGMGIGLVLLMDVRGLVWAGPVLVVAALAAARVGSIRRRVIALGLLLLPIVGSYQVGAHVFMEGVPSLERQMDSYVDDVLTSIGSPPTRLAGARPDLGSIWGRTPVVGIPASLLRSWAVRSAVPSDVRDHPENVQARTTQIMPWLALVMPMLLVVLWGLRRRPLLLLGLGLTLLPFIATIHSAGWFYYRSRYLASGMPAVPVILGVGLAVLALGSLGQADLKSPQRLSLAIPAVATGLLLLVLGWVPTWFSPSADWRWPIGADNNPVDALRTALTGKQYGPRRTPLCSQVLQADFDAGIPAGSRILDWQVDTSSP
jgi:hypothetical protein